MPLRPRLALFLALLAPLAVQAQAVVPLPVGIGLASPRSLALDASGNIFVADFGNSTIQEIPAAGGYMSVTRLAASDGGFNGPRGIAIDSHGNLFVADTGNNAIKEILAEGGYVTVATLAAVSGEFNAPAALAVDAAGNVFVADTSNNAVKEILAAGGYTTVENISAASGSFLQPTMIAVTSKGDVFVGNDFTQGKEILADGGYVTATPIGIGSQGYGGALAVDKQDNLYLADNVAVADEVKDGSIIEITAASGYKTVNTIVSPIAFSSLKSGMAIDADGNVFTTNQGSTLVQEYPVAQAYAATPIPAAISLWAYPDGVAVDGAGNVFVADNGSTKTIKEIPAAGGYTTVTILPGSVGNLTAPGSIAIDSSDNLFFIDRNEVKEMVAAGGYSTLTTLPASSDLPDIEGIAIDGAGNVFLTEGSKSQIVEIPAAGGYATVQNLAANGNFNQPSAIAVDSAGNLFVTDDGNAVVKEILAAGGYVTVNTLPATLSTQAIMTGIALDSADDVFVMSDLGIPELPGPGSLVEITAASGYATATPVAATTGNFFQPTQISTDRAGNLFVADTYNGAVKEIVLVPSPLAAAILPGSRSVQAGTPATVFATLLNTGSSALTGCFPSLPAAAPAGLSLDYRPTDPSTNAVTGVLDQPVTIAANGAQSFVLGFGAASAVAAPDLPVVFTCAGVNPAPSTIGVNTVDLLFAATPVADIIALAATSSNDGTVHIGTGGGAFAVATVDAGAAAAITATADTGTATLPLTISLCQTDATGQCLAPPASSVALNFAANATPTFSIFIAATGPVPFDPANARIFVRFKDAGGTAHGATSVAVTTS